jgi:hypothetical protein
MGQFRIKDLLRLTAATAITITLWLFSERLPIWSIWLLWDCLFVVCVSLTYRVLCLLGAQFAISDFVWFAVQIVAGLLLLYEAATIGEPVAAALCSVFVVGVLLVCAIVFVEKGFASRE